METKNPGVRVPKKASFLSLASSPSQEQGQSWYRLETAMGVLRTVVPQVCNPSASAKAATEEEPPLHLGREEDGTGRPHDARCIPWCLPKSLV